MNPLSRSLKFFHSHLFIFPLPFFLLGLALINLSSPEGDFGAESQTVQVLAAEASLLSEARASSAAMALVPKYVYVDADATGNSDGTDWTNAFTDIQAAIDDVNTLDGDTVLIDGAGTQTYVSISTPGIALNKEVILKGINGNPVIDCSSSANYGISVQASNSGLILIGIENAGSFGIHTSPDLTNLIIQDVAVLNNGGSGIAINGSTDIEIVDAVSSGNGGNGLSILDCQNVVVDGFTSSGNTFSTFGASIGIFSSGIYGPLNSDEITVTNLTASEVPQIYVEDEGGITGSSLNFPPSLTHITRTHNPLVPSTLYFYFEDLVQAYGAAAQGITDGLPADSTYVQEVSTGEYFVDPNSLLLVNAAIFFTEENNTIHLEAGIFDENIVIDKDGLFITGAGNNNSVTDNPASTSIIKPVSAASSAQAGIYIEPDVIGTHIDNIRIRDFKAGIEAERGNHSTTVTHVGIVDNTGPTGSNQAGGIYMNGPVDDVFIDNCYAHGNQNRGIVIWNGFKTNITITNNTVEAGTGCCGIELQDGTASGVTMSNNTVSNSGDSGMSAIGLNEDNGPNTISGNNLLNNGRFGIEIKNPDGGVTVDGNTVEIDGSNVLGASHLEKDLAGIAVFRRSIGLNNSDIPKGVTVSNNTVRGYQQTSADEGFGIVVEGVDHVVSGNTLESNDVALQIQGGGHPNANYPGDGSDAPGDSDNYFGRGNAPYVCNTSESGNTYMTNGIDRRVVPGVGIVWTDPDDTGLIDDLLAKSVTLNNGTDVSTYCTIQAAVDAAAGNSSEIITASPSVFVEDITIDKDDLDIRGANYGVNPNTDARGPESVIMPAASGPYPITEDFVTTIYFSGERTDIAIDGFTIDGDNPDLTSGAILGGADVDASEAMSAYDGIANTIVKNNIFKNFSYGAIDFYNYYNGGTATTGNLVQYNLFQNILPDQFGIAVLIYNNAYTDILDNVFEDVRVGVQTGNFYQQDPGDGPVIANNMITSKRLGIWHNLAYSNASEFVITDNTVQTMAGATNNVGLFISSIQSAVSVQASGNNVTGARTGVMMWNTPTSSTITVTDATLDACQLGVFANNYDGYNSNGDPSTVAISNLVITGADTAVFVKDNPLNTDDDAIHLDITNCNILNSTDLGILASGNNASFTPNYNNIQGSVNEGVKNLTGVPMDARYNYWGDPSGPGLIGNGSGDRVSDDVHYCPWLDDEFQNSPAEVACAVRNNNTLEEFPTIMAAINAANTVNDHTIEVLVDDHTEPGQVVISKSLTIQGQGKELTTLRSNYNTASSGHGNPASAWWLTDPGTVVHIKDMTLDGNGMDTYTGLRFQDGGSVDNVAFNDIKHSASPYLGIAVQVQDGNVDITNSMFTNIGRIGAHYRNGVIPGAAISGTYANNMYTGKGNGDWLDYAMDISGGVTLVVDNNTVSNNTGVATSDGSTSAGFLVTTYFPAGQNLANDVTFTNNNISANTTGIAVGFDGTDNSVVVANNNNIAGNTDYGIFSTAPLVDGTMNWWGDATGPAGEGQGTGDAVSEFVDYCPWLDAEDPAGNPVSNIENLTQGTFHCSIQDAVDNAEIAGGDIIQVGDITVEENVVIDKGLTLQSANGKEFTTISGDGGSPTISIQADDVTVDGFTLTNPGGTNAVSSNNNSNIAIKNNLVIDVAGASVAGTPVHSIVITATANTIDNISITDNMVMDIIAGEGGSVSAITVGFSTNNYDVTNLVIDGNMINNIDASTLPWQSGPSGGKGAYGILLNLGANAVGTGKIIDAQVTNNQISGLEGLWAHGIGLEGDTPGALVSQNTIDGLVDNKAELDAAAIMVEQNDGAASVLIEFNDFTNLELGVRNVTGSEVSAGFNWWGDASGPSAEGPGTGVGADVNVDYCPWLDASFTVPGQPVDAVPVAICIDLTVTLDENEMAMIVPEDVDNASFDECEDNVSLSLDISSFDCTNIGENTVTLTASDAAMQTDDCQAIVTVVEGEAPMITTCPAAVVVEKGTTPDPYITGWPVATDNCSVSDLVTTYDDETGALEACNATGLIVRTFTVIDLSGNEVTCEQNITIEDTQIPTLVDCPAPIDLTVDENCEAVLSYTSPTAVDFGYFEGFEEPDYFAGNSSTLPSVGWNSYQSQLLSVPSNTDGITSFDGSAHGKISVENESFTGVFSRLGGYTTFFNEGWNAQVAVYIDLNDPAVLNDTYGWDLSTAANGQDGSHQRDFIFHAASDGAGNVLIGGSNNTNFTRRNDLASINHYEIDVSGWYIFEWEFRNDAGILAVDLILRDDAGTFLWSETRSSPADVVTTEVGGNRYMWFTFLETGVLHIDNAQKITRHAVSCDPPSGTMLTTGIYDITCSTEECGVPQNPQVCTTVTVSDITPPVLTDCPVDVTFNNNPSICAYFYDFPAPTATDNCDQDPALSIQGTFNGSTSFAGNLGSNFATNYPVGVTRVAIYATDTDQNRDSCVFFITVKDIEDPVITGCPSDIILDAEPDECGRTVNWSPPTASDNCTGVMLVSSHLPGDYFPVGSTTVTYTATDVSGNMTICSFDVAVSDAEAPLVSNCPGDITVEPTEPECDNTAAWTEPTAVDNCDGVLLPILQSHMPGDAFPNGTTTVRYEYQDNGGNIAACEFEVTVRPCVWPSQYVYVDADKTAGGQTGVDWANAFLTIQEAIAVANTYPQITEIRVAEGTYLTAGDNSRTASFNLTDGVRILGGFEGIIEDLSDRDVTTFITILSGDVGNGNDLTDNAFHVVTVGAGVQAELDGLVIAEGYADDVNNDGDKGAGIYNEGSLILTNVRILDCTATATGGAIYNAGGTALCRMVDCTVTGCTSGDESAVSNAAGATFEVAGNSRIEN